LIYDSCEALTSGEESLSERNRLNNFLAGRGKALFEGQEKMI
jgi:hypothetical protein